MTLHDQQAHFSQMFAQLVLHAFASGYEAVINEVARTPEQQQLYVQQGKSKTLKSLHLQRLAGDLLLFKDGTYLTRKDDYAALGAYWKQLDPEHNGWGGDWGWDANHFECRRTETPV